MSDENQAQTSTPNEQIKMSDGTTQSFSPKKKLIKEISVTDSGTVKVKLYFRNGEVREFIATSDDATYAKAAAHGYSQKLGDECAGLTEIDDMLQAIDELIVRLDNGEWTSKREGGSAAGGSILARAMVEVTKKPSESDEQARERVKLFLSNRNQAEKIAMRSNPRLKPVIERMEAEKAAKSGKSIDTDALLSELDGDGADA